MNAAEIVLVNNKQVDSDEPTSEEETWIVRYPPKAKRNQIVVTEADYARLEPGEYLNDSIVDFYLRLLVEEKARSSNAFVFTSFFYSKLKADGYNAVKNWTKATDIFIYHHLLIPIAEAEHWSLCVLMHLNTLGSRKQKTAWLYFDSMGNLNSEALELLRGYIESEWNAKRETDIDVSEESIPYYPVDVPLQDNFTDCGVFLLHYAELFLLNPGDFNRKQPDSFFKPNWFELEAIQHKRMEIKQALLHLSSGGPYRDGVNIVVMKSILKRRFRKKPKRYLA